MKSEEKTSICLRCFLTVRTKVGQKLSDAEKEHVCGVSDEDKFVYVVDDEPVIASTIAAILELDGHSTKFFTSPLEVIRAAQLEPPYLLISDVMMPGMSGVDLAIQIRLLAPACKILLFSGQASTMHMLDKGRNQGHDFECLQKPVHPAELLARVGELTASGRVITTP